MLLLDGRTVVDTAVSFDPVSYHFFLGGEDITDQIRRTDKLRIVPNFNVERENIRLSEERGAQAGLGNEPLNDSTGSIFVDQIVNDPLAAPMESFNRQVEKLFALPGFKKLLVVGGIVAVVVLVVKLKD